MRKLITTTLCLAALAVAPSAANAAQTIGNNQVTGAATCIANTLSVSTTSDYVIPFDGVITSVASTHGATVNQHWTVKAVRDVGPQQVVVATSQPFLTVNNNVSSNVRMPVHLGDRLAEWTQEAQDCAYGTTITDLLTRYTSATDPVIGAPFTGGTPFAGFKLGLSAVVEPDRDNDGFGDDTQDACPTQAGTQGACVPPAKTCKVPSLKKLTKSKASAALLKANCKLGKTKKKKLKKFTKKQKKNRVRSQSPAAGAVVADGTSVTITLNTKKKS